MIQKFKNGFFADKNYTLIYVHQLLWAVSYAAMYIFTGAYFIELGMALHFVLLFYGLEFGLRGFLCPWGFAFLNKVGLFPGILVSCALKVIFFVGIALSEQNLWIGFSALIFSAMSGAIYSPFMDVMQAIFIKDQHNRTKQISFGFVMNALGGIIGSAGIGFLLVQFGFPVVVIVIAITLVFAVLPFLPLQKDFPRAERINPIDAYRFLAGQEFRPFIKPFMGDQLIIIVYAVMIPLFLYFIVGRIDVLGYLIALSLIAEKVITLFAGHFADKKGRKNMIKFGGYGLASSFLIFAFMVKTPFAAFFAQTYQKITQNSYKSALMSYFHSIARTDFKDKIMYFGTAWQMTLCFGELLVLPFYGLLAYFIGNNVFYVAFAGAILGLVIVNHFMKHDVRTL